MVELYKTFMKKLLFKNILLLFVHLFVHLVLLNACVQQSILRGDWIANSNASPIQKQGLYDGCAHTALGRQSQTIMRDNSGVYMNPYYMDNSEYTGVWRDGFWTCYMGSANIGNPVLRAWNVIGFKGDTIAYKGN